MSTDAPIPAPTPVVAPVAPALGSVYFGQVSLSTNLCFHRMSSPVNDEGDKRIKKDGSAEFWKNPAPTSMSRTAKKKIKGLSVLLIGPEGADTFKEAHTWLKNTLGNSPTCFFSNDVPANWGLIVNAHFPPKYPKNLCYHGLLFPANNDAITDFGSMAEPANDLLWQVCKIEGGGEESVELVDPEDNGLCGAVALLKEVARQKPEKAIHAIFFAFLLSKFEEQLLQDESEDDDDDASIKKSLFRTEDYHCLMFPPLLDLLLYSLTLNLSDKFFLTTGAQYIYPVLKDLERTKKNDLENTEKAQHLNSIDVSKLTLRADNLHVVEGCDNGPKEDVATALNTEQKHIQDKLPLQDHTKRSTEETSSFRAAIKDQGT